ncbi:hypothetical protein A8M58_06595 [Yersinia pestis]|nr:hypothetical protein A8M58_06595 [Yersinia pestis]
MRGLGQLANNALVTGLGRNGVISPPWRATSFTNEEEINDHFSDGIRNTLSNLGIKWRFILASCHSYSKSDTERKPRTKIFALCFLANSAISSLNPRTSTFFSGAVTFLASATRSSNVNIGFLLELSAIAKIT